MDHAADHVRAAAGRRQTAAAAARYRASAPERDRIAEHQRAAGSRIVASAELARVRIDRLTGAGQVTTGALLRAMPDAETVDRTVLLERIIGATSDLQPISFLTRGARAARTVGRIAEDEGGRTRPFGTGFLVAPDLLLTNHHVLPEPAAAEAAVLELNCEVDLDHQPTRIVTYRLAPATLFLSDERLDYTLVAVAPGTDGHPPGREFGWNRLVRQQGKIVIGEPVNIVGHPLGRLKEVAIRNNQLRTELPEFLHYSTDTEPGSSGSPVFNDQWEVVALHHSGVPATDVDGTWLTTTGDPWQPTDDPAGVHWVANEGVRVSVLLTHLFARELNPAQLEVLAGLGPQALPPGLTLPARPETRPVRPDTHPARPASRLVRRETPLVRPGSAPPARRGLPGRRPPLPGGTHLVFLHGRGQHGRDPARLRAGWAAGLAGGLGQAGLPPIDPADIWFPYYADVLADALRDQESVLVSAETDATERGFDEVTAVVPAQESTRAVYQELLTQAAVRAGMPPELAAPSPELAPSPGPVSEEGVIDDLVRRLRQPLSWLAQRSGLDEALIAAVLRDVAAYLDRADVRDVVLDAVSAELPASGEAVLVGHSFGTVVAMDLLTRLPAGLRVTGLITVGSPLGLDGVHRRLLCGGPHPPQAVRRWLNAWCPADAVTIGCPLRESWGPTVTEVITDHAEGRAHDVAEYLADPRVASAIAGSPD